METRIKTGLWVRAVLRRVSSDGTSAMILKKGDEDAGAVIIVLQDRQGSVAVLREDGSGWARIPMDDHAALQAYLDRQQRYDPDLWIAELETRNIADPVEKTLGSRRIEMENEP